jgi:GAF domain-containing protein
MIRTVTVDELARLRARFVAVFASASIVVAAVGLLPGLMASLQTGWIDSGVALLVVFIVLNGLWLTLVNQKRQRLAEIGLVLTFTIAAVVTTTPYLLLAALALLAASTLGGTRVYVAVNLIVLGKLGIDALLAFQAAGGRLSADLLPYPVLLISLTAMSVVTRFFIQTAQQTVANTRRTTSLLQTSADIYRITSRLLDLDEILDQALGLLHDRFGYTHVQAYLLSEGEGAVLTAAASSAGRALLESGYRVPMGARSVIGQVMLSGSAQMRKFDRGENAPGGEVFSGTQSQLVLPMHDVNRVIGALDLQSTQPQGFAYTDVQVLQMMTDLLAISVRNARLYEAQMHTAEENKLLYEQADAHLREIERLNQELTRSGWSDYAQSAKQIPGITLAQNELTPEIGWTEALTKAQQERRAVSLEDRPRPLVAVPITLRGEVIGAIEVEPGAQSSGADALEMVEAVAQRLALSLENVRLYEETQKAAAQELRINEISAHYQEVTTVDELLRITLQELSKTLSAERGAIRLGSTEETTP